MQDKRSSAIVWTSTETVPLVRIRAGRGQCVCVSGPVMSWYMHWCRDINRTQPCLLGGCSWCVVGNPRRALSYCSVMHWRMHGEKFQWLPAILELPWNAGVTVSSMRDKVIQLRRDREHGPVNIGTYLFDQTPPKIVGIDIVPHLMRLWGLPFNTALCLVGNLGPAAD